MDLSLCYVAYVTAYANICGGSCNGRGSTTVVLLSTYSLLQTIFTVNVHEKKIFNCGILTKSIV